MSQLAVERVLGRLVTDGEFRSEFFGEPADACRDNGFELTSIELAALLRIDLQALVCLAERLDPKIVRALALHMRESIDAPPPPTLPRERRVQRGTQ